MRRRQHIRFQHLPARPWRIVTIAWLSMAVGVLESEATTVLGVIGDWGSSSAESTSVANMVGRSNWQSDYVLALGDNNYGNLAVGNADWDTILGARYGQFMKQRTGGVNPYPNQTSSTQRFFPVVGNHDAVGGTIAGHVDYFHSDPGGPAGRLPAGIHDATQSYYDFILPIEGGSGSIHVFAMDSEAFAFTPGSQAAQIEWLRDGLRSSTATWDFVTLHRAPFSSGLHNTDPLYHLPFQQWGADAVLAGHDHLYERLRVSDASQTEMLYFVNGLGGQSIYTFGPRAPGSELRYNENTGAMRISVTDQEAHFEFLAVEFGTDGLDGGTPVDSFTLMQGNLPTPPALTADFNDDGFVDTEDLLIWSSAFGPSDLADADGDHDSDGDDFLTWQRQKSSFQPLYDPTIVAVPEPATGACMGLLAGVLVLFRPRSCRSLA